MLILTRKKSEMIRIGNEIVITVMRTGRSTVKLGIEAPLSVRVLRAELGEPSEAREPRHSDVNEEDAGGGEDLAEAPGEAAATMVRNYCVAG